VLYLHREVVGATLSTSCGSSTYNGDKLDNPPKQSPAVAGLTSPERFDQP
jgi:hypothetical protein